MSFGKANYDKKTYKKRVTFSMKPGVDLILRIMPPFGPAVESGIWTVFHSVHFGYRNSVGQMRPLESPFVQDWKTKTVKCPDAARDRLTDLKARLEQAKKDGNGPMVAALNTLVGFKGVYNLENKFHTNAMDLQGNFGVFKLNSTTKTLLDAEINKLRAETIDPLSLEDGRFFVFTLDTTTKKPSFKVAVYTEKLDIPLVGKVDRPVVSTLTAEQLGRATTECRNLNDLFFKVTSEEMAQIVAESDIKTGKSPAMDRIVDVKYNLKKAVQEEVQEPEDEEVVSTGGTDNPQTVTVSATAQTPPVVTPVSVQPTPAPTVVLSAPPVAVVQPTAQAAVVQPTAQVVVQTAPTSTAETLAKLNDADFFAQIGYNPNGA